MSLPYTDNVTLLSAVTSTTTSDKIDVSKRQQISIEFISSGFTSGNVVYSVDASNDGTNWVTGIAVQDATATASATYVTSKTVSTTSNVGVYVPAGWRYIRTKAAITTDGTATAVVEAAG